MSPRGGSKLKTTLHKCIMANGWQYYINHIGKKRTNGCSVKSMVYRGFLGPNGYFKRKKLSPPPFWMSSLNTWLDDLKYCKLILFKNLNNETAETILSFPSFSNPIPNLAYRIFAKKINQKFPSRDKFYQPTSSALPVDFQQSSQTRKF